MRYKVTYKDGRETEIWADDFNEARRLARQGGEVVGITADYSSIFTDLLNTIRTL